MVSQEHLGRPVSRATAAVTQDHLRQWFATFGIPRYLVSDNASCFVCPEFKLFCERNGIIHLTSPPRSPKSNGLVERAVQTVKAGLRKQTGANFATRLSRFLFRYRSMPTRSTGVAPAELLLGRRPRTHWDSLMPDLAASVEGKQQAMAAAANVRSRQHRVAVGERVYVTEISQLSGAGGCRWLPGTVVSLAGLRVSVRLGDGRVLERHADKVRPDLGERHPTPGLDQTSVSPNLGMDSAGLAAHTFPAQRHAPPVIPPSPPTVAQPPTLSEEPRSPARAAGRHTEPAASPMHRYNLRPRDLLRAPRWSVE